jgi:hypothetical protein
VKLIELMGCLKDVCGYDTRLCFCHRACTSVVSAGSISEIFRSKSFAYLEKDELKLAACSERVVRGSRSNVSFALEIWTWYVLAGDHASEKEDR